MIYRSFAKINTKALMHNLQVVNSHAPSAKVLAMVKANAYGHGVVNIVKHLSADAYGVASLPEAITLKEAGIDKPILLMSGVINSQELELACQNNLSVVIHHHTQIKLLNELPKDKKLNVWLKYDSGMNRLGLNAKEFMQSFAELSNNPQIKVNTLMTHLAKADIDPEFCKTQVKKFNDLTKEISIAKSICNSAGIFQLQDAHYDWVRPGLMLYGISPFANKLGKDLNLKPVMNLCSIVIAVKKVQQGETVSYGGLWRAPEDSTIAVVSVGYGDGYPITIQANTPVYMHSTEVPIVGRVAMDMLMVDVSTLPQIQIGDEVELWGEHIPVERIAKSANTIPYTLICGVTQRVKYIAQ